MAVNSENKGHTVIQEWTEYRFRKEKFTVYSSYFVDENGKEYTTSEQDEFTLTQVHNLYRTQHHIPFPEEIKAIREKYGLSAAKMAEVLDFGINSYRQYEAGEVPSLANAKLIRLAGNPANFLSFVKEKENIFSPNIYRKLLDRIDGLMGSNKLEQVVEYIWNFHLEANAFTGFVKPSFEKVAHYVIYFAQQVKPMKTRLNKLLFYADFLHFKRTGYSISGCNYRAIPYGPVPSHFRELFGVLETEKYIQIEEELSESGHMGERFLALQKFDQSLFNQEELAHMEEVVNKLGEMKTKELIELSHGEDAWKKNEEERELIDYQAFAFHLNGI
ncbi:MAG: type II toxin-antitoxin system antitoxin SocA domain-containing protein [Bacteroidota bacterium]